MKHTPGPWAPTGPRGEGWRRNYGIHPSSPGHDGGEFATVHALHTTNEAQMTLWANALLIAAAPELLEKLEYLFEFVDSRCDSMDYDHDEILAVIRKAKGETE